jgi:hypothetical protein
MAQKWFYSKKYEIYNNIQIIAHRTMSEVTRERTQT